VAGGATFGGWEHRNGGADGAIYKSHTDGAENWRRVDDARGKQRSERPLGSLIPAHRIDPLSRGLGRGTKESTGLKVVASFFVGGMQERYLDASGSIAIAHVLRCRYRPAAMQEYFTLPGFRVPPHGNQANRGENGTRIPEL